MRTIIPSLLASLLLISCASPRATELNQPVSNNFRTYFSLLPKILFRNSPGDPSLRMICFPSFEREWGVAITASDDGMATAEYVIAEQPIWQNSRPQDIRIDRTTAHMTTATAETLHTVWTQALAHPKQMRVRNSTGKGVGCQFDGWPMKGVPMLTSEETWAPRNEYPTGILLELGELVRDLTQVEASERPTIESRMNQRSRELLDWFKRYKEIDRPTNPPELMPLAPDHVGITIKPYPSMCWLFLTTPPPTGKITFTLVDSRLIKPLLEVQLPSAILPEKNETCHCVNLKDYDITLEPYVQYRWYISLIQNTESRPEDVVVGGVIERCTFEVCRTAISEDWGCDKQQVVALARDGFWHDAVSCLCDLIRSNPDDQHLRRLLHSLLKQGGLLNAEQGYLVPLKGN